MLRERLDDILAPRPRPAPGGVPHDRALAALVAETGVDLSTARVRVGLSRGHLLDVVVSVPLDVPGDAELLEECAELYLEQVIGPYWFDAWIGSVGVARVARSRGLLMVAEAGDGAETYPLVETAQLVRRGILGLEAALPPTLLGVAHEQDWLALELSAGRGDCLQAERAFASTWQPEALKAALEGLPFDSARFTQADELFVWFAWRPPRDALARLQLREERERSLAEVARDGGLCMVGSGFGPQRDYVDVLVRRDARPLVELCGRWGVALAAPAAAAEEREGDLELGFYDSELRARGFRLSRTGE
ncbi:MAG TPA: hypothetical protein VLC09_03685 [Polyangiaceae bacterium]|nr:hypothetical protein [Polyangiaceae bacterium]